MAKKRQGAEQIIPKLREAEVELARGLKVPQVCRKLEVTEQTYYRRRKEYGGLRMDQAKRLKDLDRRMLGSRSCRRRRSWTRQSCVRRQAQAAEPG